MNKDFLKKMKIDHGANTFYNKVIDKFAKKPPKNWTDLKISITH